ncbi:MAG: YfcE family phosphodiesterase [Desulfobacter sp.]
MAKLLVTADLHGSMAAWLTVTALLSDKDSLAVAGDLFDTRYGQYGHPDFRPDQIRADLKTPSHPFYYVYGNCDVESYFPGYAPEKTFRIFGKKIFLHHGHRPLSTDCRADIVIQGHTHLCHLEKKEGTIFMNPGSLARPRNQMATYGRIDENGAALVELSTGTELAAVLFD